jgi:hypothetical protein
MIGFSHGVRSCRVNIRDMEGLEHTVQVTAGTLFEAVALGLTSIRTEEWVNGVAEGLNTIKVSVQNTPIEHSVKLKDFNAWLKKEGGTPRERTDRKRIKEILGLPI